MSDQNLPIVAIIGRPNVGKSSLFNRMVGRRVSIVHSESGVTRDRVVCSVRLADRHFVLVDTGGLGVFSNDGGVSVFDQLIRSQVEAVIQEADCLIWVVDSVEGMTPLDREIERLLREAGDRKVIVAANKADNDRVAEAAINEFSTLPFAEVIPVSCSHGRGLGRLAEQLSGKLPAAAAEGFAETGLKLAVVGRPNVGKSSLVNALLGEPRVLVSEVAGTTRDAVDIPIEISDGRERAPFVLIDTAGLRQRRRVDSAVELFSVMRAENAIKRSDIVILMLDGTEVGSAQDRRVARIIQQQRKPCIIVANKWDIAGKTLKLKRLREEVEHSMPFMQHAPVIGACAISGYNLRELLQQLFELREQMRIKVPTSLLNQFLQDAVARTPPPAEGTRRLKLFYATMVENPPPRFLLFVNDPRLCRANYRQFLENQLQAAFFPKSGLPVLVEMKARRPSHSPPGRAAAPERKGGGRRQPASPVRPNRTAGKKTTGRSRQA